MQGSARRTGRRLLHMRRQSLQTWVSFVAINLVSTPESGHSNQKIALDPIARLIQVNPLCGLDVVPSHYFSVLLCLFLLLRLLRTCL